MKELTKEEKEIMEALKNCDFNNLFNDEGDDESFSYDVYEPFKNNYKGKVSYETGATKGVLIFEDLNFVIKIPFKYGSDHRYYGSYEGYNEYSGMYRGAECPNGWDYCEVETIKYENAEDYDVSDCFAKTELIGTIDGYPIYKQEFATIYSNSNGSTSCHTRDDEEKVEKYCDDNCYDCFNIDWLSDAFIYFGEKKFCQLMQFIRDFNIADLHSHNLGYIGMKPVLVDYSSFND